jgi:anti-sigma regulatory factor (Ser/Thr protein kinase)
MPKRLNREEFLNYILNELDTHFESVVHRTAKRFNVSPQAVRYRVKELVRQGVLEAVGETRARKYVLARNEVYSATLPISNLAEDIVFERHVLPKLGELNDNILRICRYGFTEMLNNAIDHSQSTNVIVDASSTPGVIEFRVIDTGVGIFRKIKEALGLDDERQSLLELSKGKMTTDRSKHSGEGIFFTSRVFDHFSILSGTLYFWHRTNHDDWLVENRKIYSQGTYVNMRISKCATTKLADVFSKFGSQENENTFSKTHVPVALAQYGDGNLVSRSQAKRVLARFNEFNEVMLDFEGIETVGQAFADEIFRVFRLQNPTIKVASIRCSDQVRAMINRAEVAFEMDRLKMPAQRQDTS